MGNSAKIEVCTNCSGFDVSELKGKHQIKVGCIGKCTRKHPELKGKVYGFLNGDFTVTDTKEAFFAKVKALDAFVPKSNKSPLVDAFLDHVEQWKDEFEELRAVVLSCDLTETLKWGQPCYTHDNKNIVILGGFKEYIALSFFKGALLKDDKNVLVRQTENVQAGRQLRFTGTQEISRMEATIVGYVNEAIAIEKAGLKVPVDEKPALAIPEELQRTFDNDPACKDAFFALTPGRQKGYLYYFLQAKQVKTRETRIEKCMPRIRDGKGLDD